MGKQRKRKEEERHLAEAGGKGDGLLGGRELGGVGVPGGLRHGGAESARPGSGGGGARVVGGEEVVAGKIRGEAEARWAQRDGEGGGGGGGGVERVRERGGDEAHARRSHVSEWPLSARRPRCIVCGRRRRKGTGAHSIDGPKSVLGCLRYFGSVRPSNYWTVLPWAVSLLGHWK